MQEAVLPGAEKRHRQHLPFLGLSAHRRGGQALCHRPLPQGRDGAEAARTAAHPVGQTRLPGHARGGHRPRDQQSPRDHRGLLRGAPRPGPRQVAYRHPGVRGLSRVSQDDPQRDLPVQEQSSRACSSSRGRPAAPSARSTSTSSSRKCSSCSSTGQRDSSTRIELNLNRDVPKIYADAGSLRQLLMNLLLNAIYFTPEGGSIFIKTEPDDTSQEQGVKGCQSRIRLSVRDTGTGIPGGPHRQDLRPLLHHQARWRRYRTWPHDLSQDRGRARRHYRCGKRTRKGRDLHHHSADDLMQGLKKE